MRIRLKFEYASRKIDIFGLDAPKNDFHPHFILLQQSFYQHCCLRPGEKAPICSARLSYSKGGVFLKVKVDHFI